MRKITLRKRIVLISILNFVAAFVLILSRYINYKAAYFKGFGVGLLAVALPMLIILIIKSNNKDYIEEYNLSINDERIKRNVERSYSLGFSIQTILLLGTIFIAYLFELDLYPIVLSVVGGTLVFVKIYLYKLNK